MSSTPTPTVNIENNNTANATTSPTTTNAPTDDSSLPTSSMLLSSIFNKETLIIIIWFLAIYYIVFVGLGIFFESSAQDPRLRTNRSIDIVIVICLLIYLVYSYYTLSNNDKENIVNVVSKEFVREFKDPMSLLYVGFALAILYIFNSMFNISSNRSEKPLTLDIIEHKLVIYALLLLIADFFMYILNIPVVDMISNTISNFWNSLTQSNPIKVDSSGNLIEPTPTDSSGNPITSSPGTTNYLLSSIQSSIQNAVSPQSEVFNISNNLYTYDDAQAICAAYGSNLATYDQIEDAYNNGAEWCNYGWSDGQSAYFPTQKDTWKKLDANPATKNSCGRPGINGGYMLNPHLRFGVNCYGVKPTPSASELAQLSQPQQTPPSTPEQQAVDQKVQYWKSQLNNLNINSYNKKTWSEFVNGNVSTITGQPTTQPTAAQTTIPNLSTGQTTMPTATMLPTPSVVASSITPTTFPTMNIVPTTTSPS